MKIAFDCLPGGLSKAVTMSFDDGRPADVPLAQLFQKYGIKGTFHYNSENLNTEGYLTSEEVEAIGAYHEISAHGATHPFLERLPIPMAVQELMDDRRCLEKLAKKPVRGMSYPYGTYSPELIRALRHVGITYSRTIKNTSEFDLPEDFMEWHPTCHQSHDVDGLWERFCNKKKHIRVFYVWGHSYELDRDQSWDRMEHICEKIGRKENIWYATNQEIVDYVTAMRNICLSAEREYAYNPSAIDVWILVEDIPVCIPAGQTVCLKVMIQ